MKYMLFFCFSVFSINNVFADDLSVFENNYKNINSLKNKLEQLELKRQIQDVEIKILENKNILNPMVVPAVNNEKPKAIVKVRLIESENTFDPKLVKLLYLVGSNKEKTAVLSYDNKTQNIKDGGYYHGWRLNIKNRNVVISKGSDTVEL